MIIAAIKCDFCGKAFEIGCRKVGQEIAPPDGWAIIVPMITIKGTPKVSSYEGKIWNPKTNKYDLDPSDEVNTKIKKQQDFKNRREKLREKFDKNHVCEDCVEQILTGKISIKIGHDRGSK